MNTKKMIITIYFNSFKWSEDRLTKPWIDNRMNLFFKYTLPSLKAQTNQDFIAYVYCDIESMDIIRECLKQREPLPNNIVFSDTGTIKTCIKDDIRDSKLLYLIRIDSDNMYQKDYIQRLYDYEPKPGTEALISQNGYMFHDVTKELVYYYMKSPSFYTFIYKVEDYLANKLYVTPGGHASVITSLRCEIISGNNYIISIHDSNVKIKSYRMSNQKVVENPSDVFPEFGVKEL